MSDRDISAGSGGEGCEFGSLIMSQPGIGAMLGALSGYGDTVEVFSGAVGKTIADVSLGEDDALRFTFEDGSKIKMFDNGQSCCEARYMRTDDDLTAFIGAKLLDAIIKDGPEEELEYGECHEVQFLEIKTDRGSFVMSSHNEHNGYYGGISLECAKEE